jgi:hypothetical protein
MSDIERLSQAYLSDAHGNAEAALRHALADWHASVDALMRDLAPGYLRLPPLAPVAPPKERPARVLDVDSTQAV